MDVFWAGPLECILGWGWREKRPKPALNLEPSTLNPRPSTLNPQRSTLDPQPSILNSQPSTLGALCAGTDGVERHGAFGVFEGGQGPARTCRQRPKGYYIYLFIYSYIHLSMYLSTYLPICTYTSHMYIFIYIYIYTYISIYTYIYVHIHMYCIWPHSRNGTCRQRPRGLTVTR